MIKKIFLLFIVFTLVLSCGKKGDPIYEELKTEKSSTKIKVVQ